MKNTRIEKNRGEVKKRYKVLLVCYHYISFHIYDDYAKIAYFYISGPSGRRSQTCTDIYSYTLLLFQV